MNFGSYNQIYWVKSISSPRVIWKVCLVAINMDTVFRVHQKVSRPNLSAVQQMVFNFRWAKISIASTCMFLYDGFFRNSRSVRSVSQKSRRKVKSPLVCNRTVMSTKFKALFERLWKQVISHCIFEYEIFFGGHLADADVLTELLNFFVVKWEPKNL